MFFHRLPKFTSRRAAQFASYFAVLLCACFYGFYQSRGVNAGEKSQEIENALYTRAEFFGADALVPFPTEQARTRLGEVAQKFPNDAEIIQKLAVLDEILGRFEDAENELKAIEPENLPLLAGFYERRGAFEKQAEILEKIMENADPNERGAAFSELIFFAKKHELKKYLAPEFYEKTIAENEDAISVLLTYIDQLKEEKNFAEAAKILRGNRLRFPAMRDVFLEKEIEILNFQGKSDEAEKFYIEAFDPAWSERETDKFFDYLSEKDRLKAFESELKKQFKSDPSNFQAAARLLLLRKYNDEEFDPVIDKLENSRKSRKIAWSPDELLMISKYLIDAGDGERASRFLYTLCTNPQVREKSDLRRRALYQIFELLSDAGTERIALTRGNLDFYESVATADTNPGITTGILSLIFSDASPSGEFAAKQNSAVKLFNRAAAYRVFVEFKKEYADAPELAQMYLDIIRLYTNAKNTEIAEKTLEEFAARTDSFADYADAALKLADAYIAVRDFDKEQNIYRKLLDFLGKSGRKKFDGSFLKETGDLTQTKPQILSYPPASNEGINDDFAPKKQNYYYEYEKPKLYRNFLDAPNSKIYYADVLARFVASLARENRTQEILNLYAAETAKYPDEEALFEQMLQWLGQTNLAERQFEVYQKALGNFQSKSWRDRFARWLIRNKRSEDFENFSRNFVATFDDAETQEYLKQFIDGKEFAGAKSLDGQMFFALYSLAHARFPHNPAFVRGLLRYFKQNKMDAEWRNLMAQYYFESPEMRAEFNSYLAQTGVLRDFLKTAEEKSAPNMIEAAPYKLFRADASAWLSDFEHSIVFYRELNALYPNQPEFSENFLTIARSFGQTNRNLLLESATFAQKKADDYPSVEDYRVCAGELQAELGDYARARENWRKVIDLAAGEKDSYLNTATVFWDYFQFDDALLTINELRKKRSDLNLYAMQTGAIFEAQNELDRAIPEYLKALDENEIAADRWRAKERLKILYQKPEIARKIDRAFEAAKADATNEFRLTFNFADALYQMDDQSAAVKLILQQIEHENSEENLLEARQFFRYLDETEAIQKTLRRLIETSRHPRDTIAYRLQLAELFRKNYETEKSRAMLADLLRDFPLNYGVLKEVETFYWDSGDREKSLAVLNSVRPRAKGFYYYQFSRKLAARLNSLNRPLEAEKILLELQNDNPNDTEIFEELSDIYVRTNNAAGLRKTFAASLQNLKDHELEPREYKYQSAELRQKMIAAFTRLKDYDSAAEQYVEIINREPENDEILEEAVNFAKRYGGAQKLTEYYEKVAAESFKNYRWNAVLARIYESGNNLPRAAENYRTAIFNQPEMPELYDSLTGIYLKMQNFQAALETLEKLIEISGEDVSRIKRKIEILDKLGKKAEAEDERAKLPAEELPKPPTLTEQFSEARNLDAGKDEKSLEKYRAAFDDLARDPVRVSVKRTEISDYVHAVYAEDALGSITERLWNLRQKLTAEIAEPDSVNSGKARENLAALDAAFAESVSQIVKTNARGDEISALREDLKARFDETADSDTQKISLLQNLIRGCGFDDLREKSLLKNLENSSDENRGQNLRAIVDFYQNRGEYRRTIEILQPELESANLDFVKTYAENARLLGERENERKALRLIFTKQTADDNWTNRYLESLYRDDRAELERLIAASNAHHVQIIDFLISKNEPELARSAIGSAPFKDVWKMRRAAETSLLFKQFEPKDESSFVDALKPAKIGELLRQKRDENSQLTGKDWFDLSQKYGRWLFGAGQEEKAEIYLAAAIEQNPNNPDAQFELGYFYLERQNYARALEHFRLANELHSDDKVFLPYIGAAYFKLGEREKSFETWSRIIAGKNSNADDALVYLKTLSDFGQAAKARGDIKPILEKILKDDEWNEGEKETLVRFVRQIAETFSAGEAENKTQYFLEICQNAPKTQTLPQLLIEESLVAEKDFGRFYKILIDRAEGFNSYEEDSDFVSLLETSWDAEKAENLYDADNDFEFEEATSERLGWQRKYLEYLIENLDYKEAARLVAEMENSLKGHYPRPVWLRLESYRVLLNQNQTALVSAKLRKFTGIELLPENRKAVLPNLERFNQAVNLLKNLNREDLILSLTEAFYARNIAAGQFETANFTGLARVEFKQGKSREALETLRIMTEIESPERLAELDARPLIQKFKDRENLAFESTNALDKSVSLNLAAEIAARGGFFDEARTFREKLREIAPDEAANGLELARIDALLNRSDEAVKILSVMISDKRTTRRMRWRSLIVLSEINGGDEAFWRRIFAKNQSLQQDKEIWTALNALKDSQTGQMTEAINTLRENDFTAELKFLKAIFEQKSGFEAEALQSFSQLTEKNEEIDETFDFYQSSPRVQQIELLLKTGKPLASLELAKKFELLKSYDKTEVADFRNAEFPTLEIRARRTKSLEARQLLDRLASAAESSGDLASAIDFLKAKSRFDVTEEEILVTKKRLEALKNRLAAKSAESSGSL